MPKMKTHKGCAKRFKATAKGKILRNSSHDAHKFSAKSARQKRRLDKQHLLTAGDAARVKKMMPYHF
ncbi:MAG TPA: 50S ribosomal protein L35 [Firmicutes bacterium]|jgi:large subunit ribosomal protein L35|nr:50S ribosomal protein L35 [Bacillota bacterium]